MFAWSQVATARRSAALVALAGLTLGIVLAGPVRADQGVAVDLGRIDVDEPLAPGQRYTLPTVRVRNPGSEAASYTLGVDAIDSEQATAPGDWLELDPERFELAAGDRQPVQARLTLPPDADPGDYEGLITAQLATSGDGTQVGAAAATRVTFTVTRTPPGPQLPNWLLPVAALMAAVGLLVGTAQRYSIRVERRAR